MPIGNEVKGNTCTSGGFVSRYVEVVFTEHDHSVEQVYHTKANEKATIEVLKKYTYLEYK